MAEALSMQLHRNVIKHIICAVGEQKNSCCGRTLETRVMNCVIYFIDLSCKPGVHNLQLNSHGHMRPLIKVYAALYMQCKILVLAAVRGVH